jgi:hypothetical protein
MIAFQCERCAKLFHVEDGLAGRRSRCKQCGAVMTIPSAAAIPLLEISPNAPVAEIPRPRRTAPRRKRAAGRRDAWISFAIGLGLAFIALVIPVIGFVVDVLMTVIHELGHVATAWILGSPALPSFDLAYGGGVSYTFGRQPILIILVYAAFAGMAYRMRKERTALVTIGAVAGLYTIAVFSPLRDFLITAMGHGTELLLAGVFIYRALSGSQILRSQERPLYAFLGLYIIFANARFACRLILSDEHREDYALAKGGGHSMDFSRIANEQIHVRLEVVAAFFLLACALTPLIAFLVHHYRRRGK